MEKCQFTKIPENPYFPKGSSVEVRSNDPGFDGSWYEATILEVPKDSRFRYYVQYTTLLSTPPSSSRKSKKEKSPLLEEKVCMSMIRPVSPCPRDKNAVFQVFQEVEAYHNDGWWPGVILKKMDETADDGSFVYNVAFPLSREVFSFGAYDLREKRVWVADDQGFSWKLEDQLGNCDYDTEDELYKTTFQKGTRVEVSYDKGTYGACWFVATILKVIGRTYCLVEYETLKADTNDSAKPSLEEVVDMQYIRPCPPEDMSKPTSFKELEKVEAFYKSGWFSGVVSAVIATFSTTSYGVKITEQDNEGIVPFGLTALRIPLVWEEGQWAETSQDKDNKAVQRGRRKKFKRSRESGNLTDDQSTKPLRKLRKLKGINGDKSPGRELSFSHDKDGNSEVDDTGDKQRRLSENRSKNKGDKLSTPNSAKKTTLPAAENQKDFSTQKQKPSPSHDKEGKSLTRTTRRSYAKRSKSKEEQSSEKPIAPEPESPSPPPSKETTSESTEIFKEIINDDIVELNHDTQSYNFETPVIPKESVKEILCMFPQNPHLRPLHSHPKTVQESMSYGLMLTFVNLVMGIKHLTIESSDKEFEDDFSTLKFLEEYGFSTERVRVMLERLKEARDKVAEAEGKKGNALSKVEELRERKERVGEEVSEVVKKIAGLEEEIRRKKSENEMIQAEIEELKCVVKRAEEESDAVKAKFGEMFKMSW